MGRKLTPQQKELYQRVDEVLHYLWAPIGVSDMPPARDEYHGYAPKVFSLLLEKAGAEPIVEYLTSVERDNMGLRPAPDRAQAAAKVLIEYEEWISENVS